MLSLRRLIRDSVPPIVLEPSTPTSTVARMVASRPGAIVMLIHASFVVCVTLALEELEGPSQHAADWLAVKTPMLEPETDVESARTTMLLTGVDRVLVVARTGQLLGVITRMDLDRATRRLRISA
jgi:CBS domain-containing protein